MTPTLEPMLNEFREEAAITRRVLARIPADKLTWKPHAKSMTLGQLAMHIATVPGALSKIAQLDEFDAGSAAEHRRTHLGDKFLFRVICTAKRVVVHDPFAAQARRVSSRVSYFVEQRGVIFFGSKERGPGRHADGIG